MLESHYAPRCRVLLAESPGQAQTLTAKERAAGCLVEVLDYGDDLVAYAQDLYARLRAADRDGMNVVVAVLPAPVGLGHALRDRLTKAAAAR
jgi:L-threonylcarbamoyladenylate synthase